MSRRINVHIDFVRLASQDSRPDLLAEEIRAELLRQFDQRGVPRAASTSLDKVETRPVDEHDSSGPGTAVARVVYEGMRSSETDTHTETTGAPSVQRAPHVSQPGDRWEREAETADEVMRLAKPVETGE